VGSGVCRRRQKRVRSGLEGGEGAGGVQAAGAMCDVRVGAIRIRMCAGTTAGRARGVAGEGGEGGRWQAAAWDTRLAVVAERERGSSATGDLQCHIGAATTRRRAAEAREEQEQKCSGAEEQVDSPRAQRRRAASRTRSRASQAVAVARRAEALLSLGREQEGSGSRLVST
jgi:hypothetical protein